MKYGATPLIRMLGPKRRTSGTTPFGPSMPGGVPGPDSPGDTLSSKWVLFALAGPPARNRYRRNVDTPVIMEPFLLNMYAFMPVLPFAWTTSGLPRSPAPSIGRRRHQPRGATSRAILHQ